MAQGSENGRRSRNARGPEVNRFSLTRRDFVRIVSAGAAVGAVGKVTLLEPTAMAAQDGNEDKEDKGPKIRFASIGTGIRGCDLLRSASKVTSGICVGAADLYTTRHTAAKEAYGADIPTTGDYRRFLDDKNVDAVVVATSDHLAQAGDAGCGGGGQGCLLREADVAHGGGRGGDGGGG